MPLKSAVFWDVAPCTSCVNRHFRRAYHLHLQGRKIPELQPSAHAGSSLMDFSTLKMEAICSSETSGHTRSTRRHIHKAAFFIVTGVITSNLTWLHGYSIAALLPLYHKTEFNVSVPYHFHISNIIIHAFLLLKNHSK
jgi:hypothetical protein